MWISDNQRNWFPSSRLKRRNQFREILRSSLQQRKLKFLWDFQKQNFFQSGKLFHSVNSLIVYSITDHTCSVDFRLRGKSHEKQLILPAWWKFTFHSCYGICPQSNLLFARKNNHHDLWTKSTETKLPSKGNQRETNWILTNFLIKFIWKFWFVSVPGWHLCKLIDMLEAILCYLCNCAD